jgi:hypothetical protein
MEIRILDTIVLDRDLPDQGLKRGDIGAVIELYEPDGLEVEFVKGSGKTQALVTLKKTDICLITDTDILSVRSLKAA